MFAGFPKVQGLCIVPNELMDLRTDPYTWAVIMYFARRIYRNGEPVVQATMKEIETATGIGETKLREVLHKAAADGYLICTVNSSPSGNSYGLKFTDGTVTSSSDDPHPESYRDWLSSRVRAIVADVSATTRSGKPMTAQQRRLRAGLWAWNMIFGSNTPCDPKVMVEMIAALGGSPVKVTRFLLRHAESQPWEMDQRPDQKMLLILKGQLKRLGGAAEKRRGLGDVPDRQMPTGRLPDFSS